jgi:hypothetical protein
MKRFIVANSLILPLASHAQETAEIEAVAKPAAVVADGIPDVPQELAEATKLTYRFGGEAGHTRPPAKGQTSRAGA